MHNEPNDDLIGSAEVSSILHVDRSTISRWVKAGKLLPVVKESGVRGELFFSRTQIEAHNKVSA